MSDGGAMDCSVYHHHHDENGEDDDDIGEGEACLCVSLLVVPPRWPSG